MLCYSVVASNMIFIANLVIDEEKENDPLQLLISPFIKEYSPLCVELEWLLTRVSVIVKLKRSFSPAKPFVQKLLWKVLR